MKFDQCVIIIAFVFLIVISGLGTADVLPNPVPENQVFTVISMLDAVGALTESTSTVWQVGDAGLTALPIASGTGDTIRSGSIAYVTYSDTSMSNGGQISETKSFNMDTHAKTEGMYNIETTKVLTYTSQNGSHLMGEESYVLDVAGNWSHGITDIVCVFAKAKQNNIPAFCNKVTASSKMRSVTTAQVETIGGLTALASKSGVPAALNYEISVTPDANSASGYADGIFTTTFTISIMEGRSDGCITPAMSTVAGGARWPFPVYDLRDYDELASTLSYIDSASAAGGVSTFNKAFSYQSSIYCEYCNQ
jgi:hypothetical protein